MSSSSKLPAFQFYPGDWRKDPGVQSLSFHDRGVWFEILCLMHESEQRGRLVLNGKPMPNQAIARLLGLPLNELETTLETLVEFGVADRDTKGNLINRRMVRDEKLRKIRSESGKKGGNPNLLKTSNDGGPDVLLNQNPTTPVKQIPTPSSSSSSSEKKEEEKSNSKELPKKRLGTRLSDQFFITPEMREWFNAKGLTCDIKTETEKFCNHFRAKTGRDATKLDWPATWRNWMLNAKPSHALAHRTNGGSNGNGYQRPPDAREKAEQRIFQSDQFADALRQRADQLERSQDVTLLGDDDRSH